MPPKDKNNKTSNNGGRDELLLRWLAPAPMGVVALETLCFFENTRKLTRKLTMESRNLPLWSALYLCLAFECLHKKQTFNHNCLLRVTQGVCSV